MITVDSHRSSLSRRRRRLLPAAPGRQGQVALQCCKMLVCFIYLSYARYMSRRAETAGEDVPESVAPGWRVAGQQ
ncbi:hypothetical protein E2C01_027612 [Portunus trituberculatus]|uniref:Uncharacterized protein n=1 Tax=Portunus trituberculatus TaxID=210409 RepID=A0A5B7EM33_PORTR|nr:hypothetical protein [Portunus trituberculatus]